jgi:hypothetical protein
MHRRGVAPMSGPSVLRVDGRHPISVGRYRARCRPRHCLTSRRRGRCFRKGGPTAASAIRQESRTRSRMNRLLVMRISDPASRRSIETFRSGSVVSSDAGILHLRHVWLHLVPMPKALAVASAVSRPGHLVAKGQVHIGDQRAAGSPRRMGGVVELGPPPSPLLRRSGGIKLSRGGW